MKFLKRYMHIWIVLVFFIFYMGMFALLEGRTDVRVHILYSKIDSYIPFCEYFVIPYFLWFFYIAATVFYFMFRNKNKGNYYAYITHLGIGMTLFLLVSLVFPNGHALRPIYIARDNVFTRMVEFLYSIDTPTNIFPSIHVFNSVAAHMAILNCDELRKRKWIPFLSLILTVTIILSTMFLKQHTVIDVLAALILNCICYLIIYRPRIAFQKAAVYTRE